jgi:hypothetical protein
VSEIGRALRKAITLAAMNQIGFAQAAETGRLVGSIGMKTMIKEIPELGSMLKRMKNGRFTDGMLNDIEDAFHVRVGDHEILESPSLLAESGGVDITGEDAGRFMHGLKVVMNKGLNAQGYLNGMNYVMKVQQRLHARGFFMRLYDDLQKAKLSVGRIRRYADIGLSTEDLAKLKAEMNSKVEMGTGWLGQQRPVNFHLAEFEPAIRDKVGLAFWKNHSQAIQRHIGGETSWWQESSLGKLLGQFRAFPIVAIEKQTLHDLRHHDIESFIVATVGMAMASLAYSAKTYCNSFGLRADKRKKYLKNRLAPSTIFAGAAGWNGQWNIIPDTMRMAGDFGWETPFAWTYQKGQAYRDYSSGKDLPLSQIPMGSYLNDLYHVATGLGNVALTPAQFNKQTFKYGIRLLPFSNNIAIKAAANALLQ